MNVAEAVGATLVRLGVTTAFGVVGSGNFHVTNALVAAGARYVAARHEGGAATMADAYARMSGEVGVVTVHQGPGLTNALTGLTEAAKSRTPLLLLAGEVTSPRSNFYVDQAALATAVGALPIRITAGSAVEDTVNAHRIALTGRTVLLNLPLDVQAAPVAGDIVSRGIEALVTLPELSAGSGPQPDEIDQFVEMLLAARRPVFVAGRGARRARTELVALAERVGALLATSAVAKGLFRGSTWDLDISGGFGTPLATELIMDADLIVGWGCALNMWTMRHGTLIGPDTAVVQVDQDAAAIGVHRPLTLGLVGDVAAVARQTADQLDPRSVLTYRMGYRSPRLAERLAREGRWRDVPYEDWGTGEICDTGNGRSGDSRAFEGKSAPEEPTEELAEEPIREETKAPAGSGRIDPRTLSIGLDDLLPDQRIIATDSGNFMGYPAMFMDVPDECGFVFTQAFQSIGLGLATAIGAALARPDRLPVAALGDGGALMGVAELETVVRLGLPMVIVVYDDEAYGAEVHHFGPDGSPLDTVVFPPADLAAIARGFGCDALTVRHKEDLAGIAEWLKGPRARPLLVDAKVAANRGSWWLEEAFRGH
ncbi:acetolactate synthase I/II/III large subunit [Acrocarpospora corrugata]|uniref:Acetolactate synthase I/II/III large subunit n=1 Tax=Acrocarpospora corrugata TaxID=35763 RepID=A0A5M3VS19_9ACTN|nr:thiamine pyrophosphate-binding protein [Acrocarpospora corrugata]GER99576.1 acetolactate synthase I/II/III large subunit [Acrocarpospora corrugata]